MIKIQILHADSGTNQKEVTSISSLLSKEEVQKVRCAA
jgi:hypothetical protein